MKEKYSDLKQFGIFRGARPISNGDYDSEESLIMQFVDMQIFALTKFLAPTISALDGSENILVNFENYAYQLKANTLPTDTQKLLEIVKFNGKINPLFHHLRHRILKINYDKNGELITSLSLTSDRTYQDFGSEADDMMFNFCNIFERRKGKYYRMLNSIES